MEFWDVYDKNRKPKGYKIMRGGDRRLGKGEYHLTCHVCLFSTDGKMLIQRRALGKYHSGGLWANACCSHPRWGETLGDAVQKRMEEELGIPKGSCIPKDLFSFNYFSQYDGLSEYEIDHVFLTDYHGEIKVDPDEIMEFRWVALEDLKKEMESQPQKFSTWFLIAAPRVMESL